MIRRLVLRITLTLAFFKSHCQNRNFEVPVLVIGPDGEGYWAENRRQVWMIAWRGYARV